MTSTGTLRQVQIAYLKMRGAGNQILVVDQRADNNPPPKPAELRTLSDRSTGPGFDQLMWVGPGSTDAVQASYRVFNADGSEVEQCGNGVRCVAWMLARGSKEQAFHFESLAGPIEARIVGPDRVTVNMGEPRFEPEKVPFVAENDGKTHDIDVNGEYLTVSVVSMGNPHCVIEVDDVDHADVARLGAAIECHPRFPERCNVGFMHVVSHDLIRLRVHERGVGETLACGTGACAAAVTARRLGRVDQVVAVNLPGGQLVVSWRGPAEPVWLTGNVEFSSEGTIDL